MRTHRPSYILLDFIAHHARREPNKILNLEIGEVFLGKDLVWRELKITAREYRTAKNNLEKWNLVTFESTNNGTVAKLIDKSIFDINVFQDDKQADKEKTTLRQTSDKLETTNNNDKKEKKDKNYNNSYNRIRLNRNPKSSEFYKDMVNTLNSKNIKVSRK